MAQSFMYSCATKQPAPDGRYGGTVPHPACLAALATRRDALPEAAGRSARHITAILGAGDHHMALALIGGKARALPRSPAALTQGCC